MTAPSSAAALASTPLTTCLLDARPPTPNKSSSSNTHVSADLILSLEQAILRLSTELANSMRNNVEGYVFSPLNVLAILIMQLKFMSSREKQCLIERFGLKGYSEENIQAALSTLLSIFDDKLNFRATLQSQMYSCDTGIFKTFPVNITTTLMSFSGIYPFYENEEFVFIKIPMKSLSGTCMHFVAVAPKNHTDFEIFAHMMTHDILETIGRQANSTFMRVTLPKLSFSWCIDQFYDRLLELNFPLSALREEKYPVQDTLSQQCFKMDVEESVDDEMKEDKTNVSCPELLCFDHPFLMYVFKDSTLLFQANVKSVDPLDAAAASPMFLECKKLNNGQKLEILNGTEIKKTLQTLPNLSLQMLELADVSEYGACFTVVNFTKQQINFRRVSETCVMYRLLVGGKELRYDYAKTDQFIPLEFSQINCKIIVRSHPSNSGVFLIEVQQKGGNMSIKAYADSVIELSDQDSTFFLAQTRFKSFLAHANSRMQDHLTLKSKRGLETPSMKSFPRVTQYFRDGFSHTLINYSEYDLGLYRDPADDHWRMHNLRKNVFSRTSGGEFKEFAIENDNIDFIIFPTALIPDAVIVYTQSKTSNQEIDNHFVFMNRRVLSEPPVAEVKIFTESEVSEVLNSYTFNKLRTKAIEFRASHQTREIARSVTPAVLPDLPVVSQIFIDDACYTVVNYSKATISMRRPVHLSKMRYLLTIDAFDAMQVTDEGLCNIVATDPNKLIIVYPNSMNQNHYFIYTYHRDNIVEINAMKHYEKKSIETYDKRKADTFLSNDPDYKQLAQDALRMSTSLAQKQRLSKNPIRSIAVLTVENVRFTVINFSTFSIDIKPALLAPKTSYRLFVDNRPAYIEQDSAVFVPEHCHILIYPEDKNKLRLYSKPEGDGQKTLESIVVF